MERVRLRVARPKVDMLSHHPIHGKGRGQKTADGFLSVNNYGDDFICAKDVPPHLWPMNARDWGFVEWLPSQSDMQPHRHARTAGAQRVLNQNGVLALLHRKDVYAAFYYYLPKGTSKCRDRRSCRITNWKIDPDTEEAVLDTCWGCRLRGEACSLKGDRVPRRFHNGIGLDGDDQDSRDDEYEEPMLPDHWRDLSHLRGSSKRKREPSTYSTATDNDDDDDDDDADNDEFGYHGRREPAVKSERGSDPKPYRHLKPKLPNHFGYPPNERDQERDGKQRGRRTSRSSIGLDDLFGSRSSSTSRSRPSPSRSVSDVGRKRHRFGSYERAAKTEHDTPCPRPRVPSSPRNSRVPGNPSPAKSTSQQGEGSSRDDPIDISGGGEIWFKNSAEDAIEVEDSDAE